MAYVSANLNLTSESLITGAPKMWIYVTTDVLATVVGAGYVTDAGKKGMVKGDIVWGVNVATAKVSILQVSAVTAGVATLIAITALA
jgi:hypothetical protein